MFAIKQTSTATVWQPQRAVICLQLRMKIYPRNGPFSPSSEYLHSGHWGWNCFTPLRRLCFLEPLDWLGDSVEVHSSSSAPEAKALSPGSAHSCVQKPGEQVALSSGTSYWLLRSCFCTWPHVLKPHFEDSSSRVKPSGQRRWQ